MKANRRFREDSLAGAEVIGAVLLFGIFVATIALLNITAVPQAGLAAEEEHVLQVLDDLNGLQLEAEAAGAPGNVGATVGRSIQLAPPRDVGQDFFSFFLATPARASGELTFQRAYGSISLLHHKGGGSADVVYDLGSATTNLTLGRITFDPHPVFRNPGVFQLEGGGVVTTEGDGASMRFAPPVSVTVDDSGITHVTIKARILNGSDGSLGGSSALRVTLLTEAATLATAASENANATVLRIESSYGAAWGRYLNQTSQAAGLAEHTGSSVPIGYNTTVQRGAGPSGGDLVTWTVYGIDSTLTPGVGYAARDIRLTSGLALYAVSMG